MTFVAGIDIGNSTTEIVVGENGVPVMWDRMPTRGVKGSPASGAGAARLLSRMQRRLGHPVDIAVLTPQQPVETRSLRLDAVPTDLGRLVLLSHGAASPGGAGVGSGRPVAVEDDPDPGSDPVVLVATDPLGFRETVARARVWQSSTHPVVGILLAGDEARLVSSRLDKQVPVVDCVDAQWALACQRVCVEVSDAGLGTVTDPLRLAQELGLSVDEHVHAQAIGGALRAARSAAIGLTREAAPQTGSTDSLRVPTRVGEFQAWRGSADIDDLWLVDLGALTLPGLRPDALADRGRVIAALRGQDETSEHIAAFAESWSGEVLTVSSEVEAGRWGALSTNAARPDALVIDLGGGTVDVSDETHRVTAAGSGDMLTLAVADALGISRGTAEWAKRGPARRIDSPSAASLEDGSRAFLESMAPSCNTSNALHAVKECQVPTLVFSVEMPGRELMTRAICSEAGINLQRIRDGFFNERQLANVAQIAGSLIKSKLFIDETPGLTVAQFRARARRAKASHKIGLIVVDYLQFMSGSSGAAKQSRALEVSEISKAIKTTAKELDIPIIALAQQIGRAHV